MNDIPFDLDPLDRPRIVELMRRQEGRALEHLAAPFTPPRRRGRALALCTLGLLVAFSLTLSVVQSAQNTPAVPAPPVTVSSTSSTSSSTTPPIPTVTCIGKDGYLVHTGQLEARELPGCKS